jgi:hypothetical protein
MANIEPHDVSVVASMNDHRPTANWGPRVLALTSPCQHVVTA